MKRRMTLTIIVVLTAIMVFSPLASAQDEVQEVAEDELIGTVEETVEIGEIPGDLISDIIDFVLERDPVLSSQQEVLEIIEEQYELEEEAEADEDLPEYIERTLQEEEMENIRQRQEAQEKLTEIERTLVSELMERFSQIFSLRNQIENNEELYDMLINREENLSRQVEAGIIEPDILHEITEDIIEVRNSIADAELEIRMLKTEMAFNYGGEDWQELLELIEELEENIYN